MLNQITEVQVAPIKPKDGLVGFASVIFDNCLYLGSIGIMTRPEGGYRLTYPMRSGQEKNINVFYPINRPTAERIERAVITKFESLMKLI